MLSGGGNAGERVAQSVKTKETNPTRPGSPTPCKQALSYTFFGRTVVRVLVHLFSLPLIFILHWWPLAFLILSPPLQNFHVVLPTKKCLLCYFLGELRWPAAYFLLFSVFLFLYIPNLWTSTLNTVDIMDNEIISALRFRLCLSLLYKT